MKLNIGAGSTKLDGFTPIDRKLGAEAWPLAVADESVEEIRAAHILEHFSFAEVPLVLADWVRVLQPGGTIRIAVPDVEKIGELPDDQARLFALMGGQTSSDDFHRSAFSGRILRQYMIDAGLVDIRPWECLNTDTASHPISLRLEGRKPISAVPATGQSIRMAAICSIPRLGWNDHWGCIQEALAPWGIPLRRFNGVFWGQCMERALEEAVEDGLDWVLTIDYDSLFTAKHVDRLFGWFGEQPEIDALAALQSRRGSGFPLATVMGCTEVTTNGKPFLATTAHFGLTLLRIEALKDLPHPWFKGEPGVDGRWGDDRLDDDIWFWHQWRNAGKTIYIAPDVRIGHLEVMCAEFDEDLQPRHVYVPQWREAHGLDKPRKKKA